MNGLILATNSPAFEERVRQAFDGSLNGELRRWRDHLLLVEPTRAVQEIAEESPAVVSLGPGLPREAMLELARAFDRERPEISVLMIADPSPELLEHALRSGVRDVLPVDASPSELRAAFERALETAERRRRNLVGGEDPLRPVGRVITVVSPKGGSGKTTVATNLAVRLAQVAPRNVVLVDLDLAFGDVASALQLAPEHSMLDAAIADEQLDITTVKVFLTLHTSGLYVLCAPDSPAEGEQVNAEDVARTLGLLAHEFPYVVVDTSAGLSEETLTALDLSTDMVLLCAMDVPSVRSLRKELDALDRLGMATQARHFVLNRADSRVGLDMADVAATVGLDVHVEIPSSRTVPLSLNQGRPLIESEPRSPVARKVGELAARFAEVPVTAGARMPWRRDRR